jgi:hypothetical protein
MSSWHEIGSVLGLACDLDAGTMQVAVNGVASGRNNGTPFKKGVRPGPKVGSGLFPALTGGRCKVRYNMGNDLIGKPFRFSGPTAEYVAVAAAVHLSQGMVVVHVIACSLFDVQIQAVFPQLDASTSTSSQILNGMVLIPEFLPFFVLYCLFCVL